MVSRKLIAVCLTALTVILSTFGLWLQHPSEVAAYSCSQCYGKVHWTTTVRGSFAGSLTRVKTPRYAIGAPTEQYYASWVWDTTVGTFVSAGIKIERNVATRDGTFYYFGYQMSSGGYQEDVGESLNDTYSGYNNTVIIHREWSDPNHYSFYMSYYGLGANDSYPPNAQANSTIISPILLEPTKASIGMDVRGDNLSIFYTGWSNNLYYLNDGSAYPHRGMQDDQNIDYPPIACYWRPRPTDYSSIGGNLECEGP